MHRGTLTAKRLSTNEIAYTTEYVDETTTHRYQVVRMWEQDSALFLDNPALLPLAPLTQTISPQRLLSQVSQSVARIRVLCVEKLDDLAEALLDFSKVADLVTWLDQQERG